MKAYVVRRDGSLTVNAEAVWASMRRQPGGMIALDGALMFDDVRKLTDHVTPERGGLPLRIAWNEFDGAVAARDPAAPLRVGHVVAELRAVLPEARVAIYVEVEGARRA